MQPLQKYIIKRKSAIRNALELPKNQYTITTFHSLRVEIKKVNAFFDFMKFCSKNFKRRKTFKPFQKIFQQVGKIRDFQVQIAILKNQSPSPIVLDYIHQLENLAKKEAKVFFKMRNKRLKKALSKKYDFLFAFLPKVTDDKQDRYLEKKKAKIEKLSQQATLNPKQLHQLRKRIKTFDYNHSVFAAENRSNCIQFNPIFTELLGKWHDQQIVLKQLNKTIKKSHCNSAELQLLEELQSKINSDNQILQNQIMKMLNED